MWNNVGKNKDKKMIEMWEKNKVKKNNTASLIATGAKKKKKKK